MTYTTLSAIFGLFGGGCLGAIMGICWEDRRTRFLSWLAIGGVLSLIGVQSLLSHHEVNYKTREVPVTTEKE